MARFSTRARRKRLLPAQARKNAGRRERACWASADRVTRRKSMLVVQEVDPDRRFAVGKREVRCLVMAPCASPSFSLPPPFEPEAARGDVEAPRADP